MSPQATRTIFPASETPTFGRCPLMPGPALPPGTKKFATLKKTKPRMTRGFANTLS